MIPENTKNQLLEQLSPFANVSQLMILHNMSKLSYYFGKNRHIMLEIYNDSDDSIIFDLDKGVFVE